MMIELNIVILATVAAMASIAVINLLTFASVRKYWRPGTTPLVSVLLPARNEEHNIGLCLASLIAQDYENFEIIVLDDCSDDATDAIATEWATRHSRIRVINGAPLAEGWVGKSYACHQLAQAAKGDLLLFTDADTVHSRHSIRAGVAAMQRSGTDLLSVIPHQIMSTFWERMVLPLLHFSTFCFLPFVLVSRSSNPRFAMANGQYMLFRRNVYERIGGHAAIRSALVEDVWLSREVKRAGHKLLVLDGSEIVSCRMYRSFREIWQGFSKNLFPGFRYSIAMIGAMMIFSFLTSVLPFVQIGISFVAGGVGTTVFWLVVFQAVLLLSTRIAIAVKFRMDVWPSFLHPVAILVLIGIAGNSVRWVLTGGGSRWKGRQYNFRTQVQP